MTAGGPAGSSLTGSMRRQTLLLLITVVSAAALARCSGPLQSSRAKTDAATATAQAKRANRATRLVRASQGILAPVYAPLAEQIVHDLGLADAEGIGIDLGSGAGALIIELAKRTRLHWINADINPEVFPHFARLADAHGLGHRVSTICADAQHLPFRDDYADAIVSRGSYHFWPDRKKAFREIYRVLKPGAVAYIGRGFSRNLPVEVARRIRARQGQKMKYDREKAAAELRKIMTDLGIRDYRTAVPKPPGGDDVNYGVWVRFRKPLAERASRG